MCLTRSKVIFTLLKKTLPPPHKKILKWIILGPHPEKLGKNMKTLFTLHETSYTDDFQEAH